MNDPCSKITRSGLYGKIMAHVAIDQGPLFNRSNIDNASLDAQIQYARIMNRFATKQVRSKVNIGEYTKDESAVGVLKRGVNLGRTPEALLPKKVFGKIDKKMAQWDAYYRKTYAPKLKAIEQKYAKKMEGLKGEKLKALEVKKENELAPIRKEAQKFYRDNISKQFKAGREQVDSVFTEHADQPEKLTKELKKLGLSKADAYYTTEYLRYLENGGPYFNFNPGSGNKAADWLVERISTITGKKVSFNPMTSIYNVAEFNQKAPAVFGYKNTLGGVVDTVAAAKKAGVTIFERIPQLEKEGIYDNDYTPLRTEGKYDTTTLTQNILDNFSYFVGKRAGDVKKAMKEVAYRPKPWNDTFLYQDSRAKSLVPFMSFQFRHMQQYGGWVKAALSKSSSPAMRKQAMQSLLIYSAMTAAIYGDKAAIPAPLYVLFKAVDPEFDAHLKQLNVSIPVIGEFVDKGLIGTATGGTVDLGKYAQPLGGVAVGIGTDMVSNALEIGPKVNKIAKQIREGRADKAALVAINTAVSMSQLLKNGANAAVQKAIDGVTNAYLDDEDFDGYFKAVGKKVLGKDAIKEPEAASN